MTRMPLIKLTPDKIDVVFEGIFEFCAISLQALFMSKHTVEF